MRRGRLGATIFTITADSQPVYDGWGWGDYWQCADWVQWHKQLLLKYGKSIAKDKWLAAWKDQSIDASPYSWCKYDSNTVDYLNSQGIDIGNIISHATNAAENTAENAGKALVNTSSILTWLIPAGIIIIGGLFVYDHFKKK